MTKVAILPELSPGGTTGFRAISGAKQTVGRTAGEALDALNQALPPEDAGTLVVVQSFRPDKYFNESQQRRLRELMAQWRAAREEGRELSTAERAELEELVDLEVRAASKRASVLLRMVEE
jgi:aminoglycoside/choline kinase family phosphotransferase